MYMLVSVNDVYKGTLVYEWMKARTIDFFNISSIQLDTFDASISNSFYLSFSDCNSDYHCRPTLAESITTVEVFLLSFSVSFSVRHQCCNRSLDLFIFTCMINVKISLFVPMRGDGIEGGSWGFVESCFNKVGSFFSPLT